MQKRWMAACLLLAGCAGRDAAAGTRGEVPEAARYGGTAVIAGNTDVEDLNPVTLRGAVAFQIARDILFTPLIRLNPGLEPVPALARAWELNDDGTSLTFHLRDDVSWHDGPRTTAYDVKFTYDLTRNPATAAPGSAVWSDYGEMEVLDSATVRVALRPHADFMSIWASFLPIPEHLLRDVPPEALRRHRYSTMRPVGNGPFRLVGRSPGESWAFAANPSYPQGLGGRPYLDRLVYRVIPEPMTLLAGLLGGGVDYSLSVTPRQRAQLARSPRAHTASIRAPGYTYVVWNHRRPLFRDARVRRALTLAIDRQQIIDGILYGDADLGATTVSPMLWNYDPSAGAVLHHDAAAARRLLAEAGWLDRDGDGVLEDAAGREFRFTLSANQASLAGEQIAEKIQADLERVGIVASPRLEELNTLLARMQNPRDRDFDAVLSTRATSFRIDDRDSFHCSRLEGAFQTAGFCNPEVDRLLDTLPRIVDRDSALPLWREYQRVIAREQPYTFLYHPHFVAGVSNRLRDVGPDARGPLIGVGRWWIAPAERAAH
jgi:peptide/nickel transport system substrate-binding protein